MEIRNFIEQYNNISNDILKENFIKDNLHVKSYIPYIEKVAIAQKIVKPTTLNKETGGLNVNTPLNYLLFCRAMIENYTDLEINQEDKGFYEIYDLLSQSGLLDRIIVGTDKKEPLIPAKELGEFKTVCEMTKNDIISNINAPSNIISQIILQLANVFGDASKDFADFVKELNDSKIEEQSEQITM